MDVDRYWVVVLKRIDRRLGARKVGSWMVNDWMRNDWPPRPGFHYFDWHLHLGFHHDHRRRVPVEQKRLRITKHWLEIDKAQQN